MSTLSTVSKVSAVCSAVLPPMQWRSSISDGIFGNHSPIGPSAGCLSDRKVSQAERRAAEMRTSKMGTTIRRRWASSWPAVILQNFSTCWPIHFRVVKKSYGKIGKEVERAHLWRGPPRPPGWAAPGAERTLGLPPIQRPGNWLSFVSLSSIFRCAGNYWNHDCGSYQNSLHLTHWLQAASLHDLFSTAMNNWLISTSHRSPTQHCIEATAINTFESCLSSYSRPVHHSQKLLSYTST